jgi:hypothetical protein
MTVKNLKRCLMSVLMLLLVVVPGNAQSTVHPTRKSAAPETPVRLTLDEVLGWRSKYGYLIGMKEDQAIATIGEPKLRHIKPDGALLTFNGPKTDGRSIDLRVRNGIVSTVYGYPKRSEIFDVNLIFAKAEQFTFSSGLLEDSTEAYLVATREDTDIRMVTITLSDTAAQTVLDCVILSRSSSQ